MFLNFWNTLTTTLLDLQFYSWKQEEIIRGQSGGWGTTAILSAARICCTNLAVLVPQSFQTFLADLLSQTLQNGTALVIVHCFADFLQIFICVTWGGMTSLSHLSREVSAHMNHEKPLKSPCSLQENVTESCFGHFMCSWCTFPKYEANLNTNALFLQMSHYKIIFTWVTSLCLQQTKNDGSSVKTQLYYLTTSYICQLLFRSHHQADAKSIKIKKQYTCSIGQRSRTSIPTNLQPYYFLLFILLGSVWCWLQTDF